MLLNDSRQRHTTPQLVHHGQLKQPLVQQCHENTARPFNTAAKTTQGTTQDEKRRRNNATSTTTHERNTTARTRTLFRPHKMGTRIPHNPPSFLVDHQLRTCTRKSEHTQDRQCQGTTDNERATEQHRATQSNQPSHLATLQVARMRELNILTGIHIFTGILNAAASDLFFFSNKPLSNMILQLLANSTKVFIEVAVKL